MNLETLFTRPTPIRLFTSLIGRETVHRVAGEFSHLRTIILTGSLARGEGTFVESHGQCDFLGDAEFLLVFHRGARLPGKPQIDAVRHDIERSLAQGGLAVEIGLSAVTDRYLRALERDIFTYELRYCGQVLWGDEGALSLIPDFPPCDIRLEDAWRLLENRIIELLAATPDVAEMHGNLPRSLRYRVVKLYLDMATSLLVFAGAYKPTYRERTTTLRLFSTALSTAVFWPFPLHPFAERVEACCLYKLCAQVSGPAGWELWRHALEDARVLLRWELERLTQSATEATDETLWQTWLEMHPARTRLRGWLHAARKQAWTRGARRWPRWIRLASESSPRHLVYRAANELLHALPQIMAGEHGATFDFQTRLPLPAATAEESHDWRARAAAIARNYCLFVKETRS